MKLKMIFKLRTINESLLCYNELKQRQSCKESNYSSYDPIWASNSWVNISHFFLLNLVCLYIFLDLVYNDFLVDNLKEYDSSPGWSLPPLSADIL